MPFLRKKTEPKKQRYRELFESEIALAKEVFQDTLPYERIFIRNLKTATQGITLATRRNRKKANYILIWSDAFSTDVTSRHDLISTFIHELVHVWQGQYAGRTSMSYMRKSAWHQFSYGVKDIFKDGFFKGLKRLFKVIGKDFNREWGRHRNTTYCFDCEKIGEDFNTFNVEQQALIIESWFSKESFRLNGIEYPAGFGSENDFRFPYVRDCIREGNPDAFYISQLSTDV